MSSTDKVPGNKKICNKCQTKLICVEITKEYQGKKEIKPQWQNELDGKPHFYFKGKNNYECSLPKEVIETPNPQPQTKEAITDEFGKFVIAETVTMQEIENLVKKALPNDAPDAKVGMYVKEIYRQHKSKRDKLS